MTGAQHRLHRYILRLVRTYGEPVASWRRTRASGGTPSTAPTLTQTSAIVLRFCQNNRVAERTSLPSFPIYAADWWGVAASGIDIQAGDVYDNGTIAFLVTGVPDTSQGFLVIPAATTSVPATAVVIPPTGLTGQPMGLLLSLTYAA